MLVGDIFIAALALRESHGTIKGIREAARRAEAAARQGDEDEATWWRRIEAALRQMAATAGADQPTS